MTRPEGGPVTRQLLSDAPDPILVVGPHVDDHFHPHPGKLVLAVDRPDPAPATLDAVEGWVHTFGSGRTWIIDVAGLTNAGDADRAISRWVDELERRDLPASHHVLHGRVVDSLDGSAAGVRNAVVVTTSRHYGDGRRHLQSITRDPSIAATTRCSCRPRPDAPIGPARAPHGVGSFDPADLIRRPRDPGTTEAIIVGVDESEYVPAALRWAVRPPHTAQPVIAVIAWGYVDQHRLARDISFDSLDGATIAASSQGPGTNDERSDLRKSCRGPFSRSKPPRSPRRLRHPS